MDYRVGVEAGRVIRRVFEGVQFTVCIGVWAFNVLLVGLLW